MALAGRKDFKQAIGHYQDGRGNQSRLRGGPQQPWPGLLDCGQLEEAIFHCKRALEIKPGFARDYNNLGKALAAHGQLDEAIANFRKAEEMQPDSAEVQNNLAVALAGRRQTEEAILHYQKALKLKPNRAETHNHLGLA